MLCIVARRLLLALLTSGVLRLATAERPEVLLDDTTSDADSESQGGSDTDSSSSSSDTDAPSDTDAGGVTVQVPEGRSPTGTWETTAALVGRTSALAGRTAVKLAKDRAAGDADEDEDQAEDEGPDPSAASSCPGLFGFPINEKMTVVDLDPEGGCVPGQEPQDVFANYVGGSTIDECKPPTPDDGCHRYVVTKYDDACDLASLKVIFGTRVALVEGSVLALFDKDGLFSKCNQAPLLLEREIRYIGSGTDTCNEYVCGHIEEESAASPSSISTGICSFLAILAASRSL